MKHDDSTSSADLPEAPAVAATVFGDRLSSAVAYARVLADAGVERGLIGPREVPRLWDRHLLNSAAVAAAVPRGAEVLDIGSGAGLPGVPLALARDDLTVTCVEPLLRRAEFLGEVVALLDMDGLRVQRARAEDLPTGRAQVVVARAVAPLARLLQVTLPLLRPGGSLVAMKGRGAEDEVAAAAATLRRLAAASVEVRDLALPDGSAATRAVVVVAGESKPRR